MQGLRKGEIASQRWERIAVAGARQQWNEVEWTPGARLDRAGVVGGDELAGRHEEWPGPHTGAHSDGRASAASLVAIQR